MDDNLCGISPQLGSFVSQLSDEYRVVTTVEHIMLHSQYFTTIMLHCFGYLIIMCFSA